MGKECDGKCEDGYCEMTGMLACLADKAWSCLMKEKMKAVWESKRGSNMDKMAEVVVNHSMAVWMHKHEKNDMNAPVPKELIEKFQKDLEEAKK